MCMSGKKDLLYHNFFEALVYCAFESILTNGLMKINRVVVFPQNFRNICNLIKCKTMCSIIIRKITQWKIFLYLSQVQHTWDTWLGLKSSRAFSLSHMSNLLISASEKASRTLLNFNSWSKEKAKAKRPSNDWKNIFNISTYDFQY